MNSETIIKLSKCKDITEILDFTKAYKPVIDKIKLSKIIDIPFKGNYHLDMVFSSNKNQPIAFFLFKAIEALAYNAEEEIIGYTFQKITFNKMLEELSFPETKEALIKNSVTIKKCISIIKLKEKDELTFVIETNKNYIFISEIYWKS